MQRVSRAALLLGALVVAFASTASAQVPIDGTYAGRSVESPFDPAITISQYGDVTVVIADGYLTGSLDFTADTEADFGEFNEVIQRVHGWFTWEGPVQADGTFAVPGLAYSEFEIFSCQGDCSNVTAPSGNSEGYPITVTGTVADGVIDGALEWDGDPRYRFRATDPELVAAAQTTSTTTTTVAATTTSTLPDIPDATAPGVQVIDDLVFINAPPGGVLEITQDDLPPWARGIIAVDGDMYVRVGPPSSLGGGDTTVLLDGLPIARLGDTTVSGGVIVSGSDRIFVNGVPVATVGSMVVDPTVGAMVPMVGGPIISTTGCPDGVIYDERAVCAGDGITGDQIRVGDGVVIGSDPATMEARVVVAEGSLVLDRPLEYDHAAGEMVARIPAEHVAEAFGTTPADDDGTPWLGIVALLAAIGLGFRAWQVWQRDHESQSANRKS